MKSGILRFLPVFSAALIAASLFSSCTVDENAALFAKASETGNASSRKKVETVKTGDKKEEKTWAEKMKEKEAERKAELEKRKKDLAEKRAKEEALKEKKLAAQKKEEEAARKALAKKKEAEERKKARELAAQKKQEEKEAKAEAARKALAEKKEAEEKAEQQRLADARKAAAKKKAEDLAAARKAQKEEAAKRREALVAARAARSSRSSGGGGLGGLFSGMGGGGTPKEYRSEGHDVYINQRVLGSLNPSNAKIEIDLSEQRARVFKTDGTGSHLAIDTQVSTGKSGHSTSPGTFRIKEKLVEKRSTLYGRWVNSSGQTIRSDGDSRSRPSGASSFIGASMPYWMRINGGIGMHIGYVPDYPASHGCIRVPSAVQPLIYSKVGVGTSVTIKH